MFELKRSGILKAAKSFQDIEKLISELDKNGFVYDKITRDNGEIIIDVLGVGLFIEQINLDRIIFIKEV